MLLSYIRCVYIVNGGIYLTHGKTNKWAFMLKSNKNRLLCIDLKQTKKQKNRKK